MFQLRSVVGPTRRRVATTIFQSAISSSSVVRKPEANTSTSDTYVAPQASASTSTELYLNPGKWNGLAPEKIISLYWERKTKLGTSYKRSPEELNALLTTADYSGMSRTEIKKIYDNDTNTMGTSTVSKVFLRQGLRPFQFDELPSPSQDIVDEHREQRFYNRLAVYDLPLLAQYRQKYKKPSIKTHPITYRYTTYVGEEHPNAAKVVLSVNTKDLPLNGKELHKFRLLCRTRYDHETDIFKMSSDKFPEAAQNARYLHDIFQRLIKESKDMTDDFNDVPLDTRHTAAKNLRKQRNDYIFPEEWKRPQDAPIEKVDLVNRILNNNVDKE